MSVMHAWGWGGRGDATRGPVGSGVSMQGGCRNGARAPGGCALSSVCADSVSGHIGLFGWLFMVICEDVGVCL